MTKDKGKEGNGFFFQTFHLNYRERKTELPGSWTNNFLTGNTSLFNFNKSTCYHITFTGDFQTTVQSHGKGHVFISDVEYFPVLASKIFVQVFIIIIIYLFIFFELDKKDQGRRRQAGLPEGQTAQRIRGVQFHLAHIKA
jgi:hypothetical protein